MVLKSVCAIGTDWHLSGHSPFWQRYSQLLACSGVFPSRELSNYYMSCLPVPSHFLLGLLLTGL